jgi:hypothetical protein
MSYSPEGATELLLVFPSCYEIYGIADRRRAGTCRF